jgi:phage portal protein BeeE
MHNSRMARPAMLDWFRSKAASAALWMLRKSYGERVISSMFGSFGGPGGLPGTWASTRIEQVLHYRHWVFKAIETIGTLATKEPPSVVRIVPDREAAQHKARLKAWSLGRGEHPGGRFMTQADKQKSLNVVKPHETLEYVGDDHQLQRLLLNPNGPDTGADLIEELLIFLELCGEAYLWPVPYRNAPGVAELWVMPTHWVTPIHDGITGRLVDYYEVRPWGQGTSAKPRIFDADEFIVIQNKSPLSKVFGQSRLQASAEMVDSYESLALSRFFQTKNGVNIGTALELDASNAPTLDTVKRFLVEFKAKYQGEYRFGEPGILPPGVKLNRPSGDTELAYGASSDQARDYIFGMWGLTKSVVGFMEDANRAAFEAALAQVYYLVVNPRLSKIGNVLTEKLAVRFGPDLRVFWRDQTPADRATELQEWNTLTQRAPYRGNELRQWMGLEPLPEGEEVMMPMSTGPAGQMADPYAGMSDDDLLSRVRAGDANDGGAE